MAPLDLVDKGIIAELEGNCRQSYRALARKIGVSSKTIRTRIEKLVELGVIQRFIVELNPEILGAHLVIAEVSTLGSEDTHEFIYQIGQSPVVRLVSRLADGKYDVEAEVRGKMGTVNFGQFLHGLDRVSDVEIHDVIEMHPHITTEAFVKPQALNFDFTKLELNVLRCLRENPRMPVVDIARRTEMTAKRVRMVLRQLQASGTLRFTLEWLRSSGDQIEFRSRTRYNTQNTSPRKFVTWLEQRYPLEYWTSYLLTDEPTLLLDFAVDTLQHVEAVDLELKESPYSTMVHTTIMFPHRKFAGLGENQLNSLLDT
ncbi:MAG: winged helix-turn-helix transcriptional regulator [Promethearchaeota archaeon]